MKHSIIALVVLLAAGASSVTGQVASVPSEKPDKSPTVSAASANSTLGLHQRNPRYTLRKGDTFDLDFALSPEFNQTVAVQPDGDGTSKGSRLDLYRRPDCAGAY